MNTISPNMRSFLAYGTPVPASSVVTVTTTNTTDIPMVPYAEPTTNGYTQETAFSGYSFIPTTNIPDEPTRRSELANSVGELFVDGVFSRKEIRELFGLEPLEMPTLLLRRQAEEQGFRQPREGVRHASYDDLPEPRTDEPRFITKAKRPIRLAK